MMACVLRGRLRFCAVFSTPPVPPGALTHSQLAYISQHDGGGGCEEGADDQRRETDGAQEAPASNPNFVVAIVK